MLCHCTLQRVLKRSSQSGDLFCSNHGTICKAQLVGKQRNQRDICRREDSEIQLYGNMSEGNSHK